MGSDLVRFDSNSGFVTLEVEQVSATYERVSVGSSVVAKANVTYEEAVAVVRPAAEAVVKSLSDMKLMPAEVELEFGVKFTAEAGVIVSSASGEATLNIRALWKYGPKDD